MFVAASRLQAEKVARGYDCPAVRAFMDDWEEAGSCRFVGIDGLGREVSVLIVSVNRPESHR
jgi:hypothetical protein